jgi:hypothetical protein
MGLFEGRDQWKGVQKRVMVGEIRIRVHCIHVWNVIMTFIILYKSQKTHYPELQTGIPWHSFSYCLCWISRVIFLDYPYLLITNANAVQIMVYLGQFYLILLPPFILFKLFHLLNVFITRNNSAKLMLSVFFRTFIV